MVNSFFNPDSLWQVNISKSQYILDNGDIQKIANAKVSLYEAEIFLENLSFVSDGNYVSSKNLKPQTGKNYKIKVAADGFKDVESNDSAPDSTQIISVDTGAVFRENSKMFEMKIKFEDNSAVKNFYQLELFSKQFLMKIDSLGNPVPDTMNFSIYPMSFESNDLIFDERGFGNSGAVFSDELFAGKGEYTVSILAGIYVNENNSSNGNTTHTSYDSNISELIISLKSVSESYYKYLASYQKYQDAHDNPFAQPVQIFNNIKNGYGIFAGYSGTKYFLKLN